MVPHLCRRHRKGKKSRLYRMSPPSPRTSAGSSEWRSGTGGQAASRRRSDACSGERTKVTVSCGSRETPRNSAVFLVSSRTESALGQQDCCVCPVPHATLRSWRRRQKSREFTARSGPTHACLARVSSPIRGSMAARSRESTHGDWRKNFLRAYLLHPQLCKN